MEEKLPSAKVDSGKIVEMDMSAEEAVKQILDNELAKPTKAALEYIALHKNRYVLSANLVGLSTNPNEYSMPENYKETIKTYGYTIDD